MYNIIVSNKSWHKKYIDEIKKYTNTKIIYIDKKEDLKFNTLKEINPQYIFFPHWSYIVPAEIYENFECIIFHMTDLPFGRGGSPLQNLIVQGIYKTKLTALRCEKELDAGDIYMKKNLSLYGSAEEIYLRAAQVTRDMMIDIINNKIIPKRQVGETVIFKRRKPSESNIMHINNLETIFDYIRMLDADGYPKAFIETDNLRLEFERASLKENFIQADVKIMLRGNGNE